MMSLCVRHQAGEKRVNINSAPSHRQPALINPSSHPPDRSLPQADAKMHQLVAGRQRANLRDKPLPRLRPTRRSEPPQIENSHLEETPTTRSSGDFGFDL